MSKRYKVGIISANWGVYAHLPAWRALPNVEVAAICTAHRETAEAAAKAHDIPRAYWDYREMMQDPDLDIVDVGTRPSLRFDMVSLALEAGKHVYNGIPFAANIDHARHMLELADSNNRVACVDAFIQAVPAVVRMKEMITEGFLGELYGVTCNFHLGLLNAPPADFGFKWFADKNNGASALRNLGSHALNVLVFLFGEVEKVSAQNALGLREWTFGDGSTLRPEVDDNAMLSLRFKSGGIAQVNPCWVAAGGSGFFLEAYGSHGRLVIRAPGFPGTYDTHLSAARAGRYMEEPEVEQEIPLRLFSIPGIGHCGTDMLPSLLPMASIFSGMIAAIENGDNAAPDFAQALHVQQVIETAYRAIAEERTLRVSDQ
ncbi:MAG: Gfo/Idh/MocA family oxidoreductase [Spongiibacteraceae bacterium]